MIKFRDFLLSLLVMLGLTSCNTDNKTNLPQKPYETWRLGGRHPAYFQADILDSYGISQSRQLQSTPIAIGPNRSSKDPANWKASRGWPDCYVRKR